MSDIKHMLDSLIAGDETILHSLGTFANMSDEPRSNEFLKETIDHFTEHSKNGDSIMQNALGICYVNGYGVPIDFGKAVDLFQSSAKSGFAKAQCNLAGHLFYGEGVNKDLKKAFYWWSKAAKQNVADAQFNLGICYYKSFGTKKNLKKAVFFLTKASEQGHAKAKEHLLALKEEKMIAEQKEGKNAFLIWFIGTVIGEVVIFKTISILALKIISMIVCPILAFFISMILGSIFVSKTKNDNQRQNIKLLAKRVAIFCIWYIGTIGGITIISNNIPKLSLKIILIILCPIISLIFSLIIGRIFNKKCKFLNDNKLLDMHHLSYDVFYDGKKFCSVSDSIKPNYENYNGINRKISSTNEYLTYCLDGGKGCPIFEQYKNLSKGELYDHYANKM